MDTLKRIEEIIQQNAYPNLIIDTRKRVEIIIQENPLEQKKKKKKTLNLITELALLGLQTTGPSSAKLTHNTESISSATTNWPIYTKVSL